MPRREASRVSPRRSTGRPDPSMTWTRPLTTPTSSVGEGGLHRRRARQRDEVGAQARLGVVEQRQDRAPGRAAGAVAPADPVVGGDLTAQQLIEGHVQAPSQGKQRLEGEPSFPPLHLGDGAGRHAGEAGEIALAQLPAQAVGAQRHADPRHRLGWLQLWRPILDRVAEQLALGSGRASLGLADADAALTDDDDALGDLLDLAVQGPVLARPRHRPVGDRAQVQQHRAAAPEEVARGLHPPPARQRLQRVEQQQRAARPGAELPGRLEQAAGARGLRALPRVDDLQPGPPRLHLGRVGGGDDVPRGAEVLAPLGDGVVEQPLGGKLAAFPHPDDVVTPVQAAERTIQFGHAGGGGFISHASKDTANRKPQTSPRRAAVGSGAHATRAGGDRPHEAMLSMSL
jgi:hypothetical protein